MDTIQIAERFGEELSDFDGETASEKMDNKLFAERAVINPNGLSKSELFRISFLIERMMNIEHDRTINPLWKEFKKLAEERVQFLEEVRQEILNKL